MKALEVSRSLARFGAARISSGLRPGSAGRHGPLRLVDATLPEAPSEEWVVIRPRLAGICGSDLATLEGRSSRWFEPIVSFPFVPGHEVVAEDPGGRRVVVEPVLHCALRGVQPLCPACRQGRTNHCQRLAAGHLSPGLQTGYCADTGGGWSLALLAHPLQLHPVPEDMSDEAAVLVEPVACAVHAALAPQMPQGCLVAIVGAGTIGLSTLAALRRYRPEAETVVVAAKHPEQRRLARALGADVVAEPQELPRAIRRASGSWVIGNGQLAGGAGVVFDCVGSEASIAQALAVTAPGGTVVLAGMPARVSLDLTGLWQREQSLCGVYAYGPEDRQGGAHSFDLAFELVAEAALERLVSAAYPLERYPEALDHAANAGRRGAVKVVFDMRNERRRLDQGVAR